MNVIVLTNSELGWDCVVGVYSTEAQILEEFKDEFKTKEEMQQVCYRFHEQAVK